MQGERSVVGKEREDQKKGEKRWLGMYLKRKAPDRWKKLQELYLQGNFGFSTSKIHCFFSRNADVTSQNWAIQIVSRLFKVPQN